MQTLRTVLLQNYTCATDTGRRGRWSAAPGPRTTDGLPPGHLRITSPYDPDTRWSAKRDTCLERLQAPRQRDLRRHHAGHRQRPRPTRARRPPPGPEPDHERGHHRATVPDVKAPTASTSRLQRRVCCPREHYLDSGYPWPNLIATAATGYGITLVTPVLLDQSAPGPRRHAASTDAFTIDFESGRSPAPKAAPAPAGALHPTRHR